MTTAGIYVHIPFCEHICNYCDYFTTEKREAEIPQFVEMLIREIELTAARFDHDWQFDSIYLGGGSPALLPPRELEIILNKLKESFFLSQIPEITLEINPGENSLEDLQSFRKIGINRLSIGFQSLNPEFLNLLTRTHNPDDCVTIYENARRVGFDNSSIDLLYNIPRQTVAQWLNDLKTVVEMQPEHIAIYSLTAEVDTPFYTDIQNGIFSMLDAAIEGEMFRQGSSYLKDCRFTQYEVSHFAKPGMESVHNLHNWKRDPNLAFGPSAHGFDGDQRWWNVSSLDKYIEQLSQHKRPIEGTENLSENQVHNEIVMNGLRTNLGIPSSCIDNSNGTPFHKWDAFLEKKNGAIFLKSDYFHLADEIAMDLMIRE